MLGQRYNILDENVPSLTFLKYFIKTFSAVSTRWECVRNKSRPKTEKSSDVIISDNIYIHFTLSLLVQAYIAKTKQIIH